MKNIYLSLFITVLFLISNIHFLNSSQLKKIRDGNSSTHKVLFEKNQIFKTLNNNFNEVNEKCFKFNSKKFYLITKVDSSTNIIRTVPILVSITKEDFKLSLQQDDSYILVLKKSKFISSINRLFEKENEVFCLSIKFEDFSNSSGIIRLSNVDLCGKSKTNIESLLSFLNTFITDCKGQDALIIQDFTELNKLVDISINNNGVGSNNKKIVSGNTLLSSVSYINDINIYNNSTNKGINEKEKEINSSDYIKDRIKNIKNKLLEKKSVENEYCRKEKLNNINSKLNKEEEEKYKILNTKKQVEKETSGNTKTILTVSGEVGNNTTNNENKNSNSITIETLNKIENKLETHIKSIKEKLTKL